jgi:fatty acid desaturase
VTNQHNAISVRLVIQTGAVWVVLLAANFACQRSVPQLLPLIVIAQGLWLYRFYAVAHEASHRKLFPDHPAANDIAGSAFMIWVWAPITVFRQIHEFHHGANRRADGIATLDTFVVNGGRPRWTYYAVWYLMVFGAGFFLHTLISILLFLFLPKKAGKKLSPAFNSWNLRKRLVSWGEFAVSLSLHAIPWLAGGAGLWWQTLGAPILVFAWVWSVMLYIYHYDTTIGKKVQYNTRSLPDMPFFSWLLLNFNHHSVHHNNPEIPWHELPRHQNPQPLPVRERNQTVTNLGAAILQQWKGPKIVVRRPDAEV